jgi:hypothetical protein
MKLISWNMARRKEAWYPLVDTDADIALLQEASAPAREIAAPSRAGRAGPTTWFIL